MLNTGSYLSFNFIFFISFLSYTVNKLNPASATNYGLNT